MGRLSTHFRTSEYRLSFHEDTLIFYSPLTPHRPRYISISSPMVPLPPRTHCLTLPHTNDPLRQQHDPAPVSYINPRSRTPSSRLTQLGRVYTPSYCLENDRPSSRSVPSSNTIFPLKRFTAIFDPEGCQLQVSGRLRILAVSARGSFH